ncbi:MAG: hypothetical protein G01um10147_486 [Microgenomates group bacterium Gr01-1014_7]|nr:MAG: hypothetical protein G01um10147_486 [Microgenomates group bacterium Gr01-1014_7]
MLIMVEHKLRPVSFTEMGEVLLLGPIPFIRELRERQITRAEKIILGGIVVTEALILLGGYQHGGFHPVEFIGIHACIWSMLGLFAQVEFDYRRYQSQVESIDILNAEDIERNSIHPGFNQN